MRERISIFSNVYETLESLPEGSREEYFMGVLRFAFTDAEPEFADPLMKIAWLNTRGAVESAKEYEDKRQRNKENGRSGGRPPKKTTTETTTETTTKTSGKTTPKTSAKTTTETTDETILFNSDSVEVLKTSNGISGASSSLAVQGPADDAQCETNIDGSAACLGFLRTEQ